MVWKTVYLLKICSLSKSFFIRLHFRVYFFNFSWYITSNSFRAVFCGFYFIYRKKFLFSEQIFTVITYSRVTFGTSFWCRYEGNRVMYSLKYSIVTQKSIHKVLTSTCYRKVCAIWAFVSNKAGLTSNFKLLGKFKHNGKRINPRIKSCLPVRNIINVSMKFTNETK